MKRRFPSFLIAACSVLLAVVPPRTALAFDRRIDTNVIYPAEALIQNGGRVYNVQTPPNGNTPAKGDNTTDDTAAFKAAYEFIKDQFVASPANSYIIYVPNGKYLVTDTIIYSDTAYYAMNDVRFIGQSRNGTIIRLGDNLAMFQSTGAPRPVLAFQQPQASPPATYKFNNVATSNVCENLQVNVGTGNPGAVGIMFQGANSARMSNLYVLSGTGSGYYGVWMPTGSVQAYIKDVTINGYAYSIASTYNGEVDTAWEHISINNPTTAAIYLSGGGISMRDLDLEQSTLHVPAVQFSGGGASCVLLDSRLNGGSSANPAVVITGTQQDFFGRNVTTTGYTVAVQNQGATAVAAPFISEYVANGVITLSNPPDKHSFALPVSDTPIVASETNLANFINVDDMQGSNPGAVGDGTTDDTAAIQRAFTAAGTAGATVVYFPQLKYKMTGTVTVPASVTRVDFMFGGTSGGKFSVNAASSNPIVFVGNGGINGLYASPIYIDAQRTVVAEFISGNTANDLTTPVNTFLESCTNIGSGSLVCTAGQNVWARCINDELNGPPDIENYHGKFWIMGYKTENKASYSVEGLNGSYTEVLGGYANAADHDPGTTPILENSSSSMSYTGFTNSPTQHFTNAISETQAGSTYTETVAQLPSRGNVASNSTDHFIPLYIGGPRASGGPGIFSTNQDIGSVGAIGSTTEFSSQGYPSGTTPGTYFIVGSGTDIFTTADSFQFVNKSVSGNMTIVAKVDSVDPTNGYAKAGVMFRDGTATNAANVTVLVENANGITMQYRPTTGALTTTTTQTSLHPPYWIKLARTDTSSFTGYTSPDGVTWTAIATVTPTLPTSVLAGLAVCAHSNGDVCRSIIEGVSLAATP